MSEPIVGQTFSYRVRLSTRDGAGVEMCSTNRTESERPDVAFQRIYSAAFIFYGVKWMDAQYAKARREEVKRAEENKRRHAKRPNGIQDPEVDDVYADPIYEDDTQ